MIRLAEQGMSGHSLFSQFVCQRTQEGKQQAYQVMGDD